MCFTFTCCFKLCDCCFSGNIYHAFFVTFCSLDVCVLPNFTSSLLFFFCISCFVVNFDLFSILGCVCCAYFHCLWRYEQLGFPLFVLVFSCNSISALSVTELFYFWSFLSQFLILCIGFYFCFVDSSFILFIGIYISRCSFDYFDISVFILSFYILHLPGITLILDILQISDFNFLGLF